MAITTHVTELNKNYTITSENEDGGICTAHLNLFKDGDTNQTGMYNTGVENILTLIDLTTDVDHLNQKLATATMQKICQIADEDHFNIELAVDAQFNYSDEAIGNGQLEKFFKKFGFKFIPTSSVVMVRKYQE